MKIKILIGILFISAFILGQEEIPETVKRGISKNANKLKNSSGIERGDYIKWHEDAYLSIEEKLKNSDLNEQEKIILRKRLKSFYGANYVKQNIEFEEQKVFVTVVNREKIEKERINTREITSQEEIKKIELENKNIIPEKIMKKIQENSQELYPNKYHEQKIYIEGNIMMYNMLKDNNF